MPRLFVALRPPEPVRDTLIDAMEGIEGARWQDEAQLHVTLRFVGEVERPAANDLATALADVRWPRFELGIAGVGAFERGGRGGHVHAVWARVPRSPELEGLRQKVERACERAGMGRETRAFTPHITLARLGRGSGPVGPWLATFGDLAAGPWVIHDFVLYESRLGHAGAHYAAVARYPLTS
jgi:2'-5' RNA ligase